MKKIRLIVADDCPEFENCMRYISKFNDEIIINCYVKNACDCLSAVKSYKPDVVILNPIIFNYNDTDVIDNIIKVLNDKNINIIFLIEYQTEVFSYMIDKLDCYFEKSDKSNIIDLLNSVVRIKRSEELANLSDSNKWTLADWFCSLDISTDIKFYHYLNESINLTVAKQLPRRCVTKIVYPEVSKMFSTTPACVERCIRYGISSISKNHGVQIFEEIFEYIPCKKPTNSELIYALVKKIKSSDNSSQVLKL